MKCFLCSGILFRVLTNKLRGGLPGKVYFCQECQLGMLGSRYSNAVNYYRDEYRKKFNDNLKSANADPKTMYELHRDHQSDRLRIVEKYFNPQKSFLELGCSAGQFLTHIKDQFKVCEGVEFDTKCADFVKRKLKLKVYTEELEKNGFPERSFDYIAAFQVLEHALNPLKFLEEIGIYLNDTGKIFIEVPNLDDVLLKVWDIEGYKKFYFHEAHPYYFSKKSLEILFKKAGFKIDKMYFLQDYNLFNHLFWYFQNAPQADCKFGLAKPKIAFSKDNQEIGDTLNSYFYKFDHGYKEILAKKGMTSNIFIVASKLSSREIC